MTDGTEIVEADTFGQGHGHRRKCSVEIVPPGGLKAMLEAQCFELGPVLNPTDIISVNQRFRVRVNWCLEGDLRYLLCGTWCVCVAWESCGPAAEGQWCQDLVFDGCDEDGCYELDFDFEPGQLPAGDCGTVYCLCVTLLMKKECPQGKTYPGIVAGFCKDVCCIMVRPG